MFERLKEIRKCNVTITYTKFYTALGYGQDVKLKSESSESSDEESYRTSPTHYVTANDIFNYTKKAVTNQEIPAPSLGL